MYKIEITKSTEIDIFEDGSQPDTFEDCGVVNTLQSSDLKDIKRSLQFYDINLSECESFENRLEYSHLETIEGYKANETSITDWKQGRITLWLANYSIYLSKVETTELDASILLKD